MKRIPKLDGQIFIEGKEFDVCIRPELSESKLGWSISNFREDVDEVVFTEGGPHIRLEPSGLKFVELLEFGETIDLDKPGFGCGSLEMLTGRAACDLPSERRYFEKNKLRVTRLAEATKFEFEAIAGQCRDMRNVPEKVSVKFWFVVPDRYIEQFFSNAETRDLFLAKLKHFEEVRLR